MNNAQRPTPVPEKFLLLIKPQMTIPREFQERYHLSYETGTNLYNLRFHRGAYGLSDLLCKGVWISDGAQAFC